MGPVEYFDLFTLLFFGLFGIGLVAFLRRRRKKDPVYLMCFAIFYVYLVKVLDYTLFQFQSLLVLQYFMPELILLGETAGKSVNLIPLVTLTAGDLTTSLQNILLLTPFGFGLPFVSSFRIKKVIMLGALFSVGIELLQLITGVIGKTTFRIADINDVIFNTIGTALGYALFVGLVRICRRMARNGKMSVNPILRYVTDRPQVE